ncbi:MAG: hypothetical protein CMD92_02455 [Gammaproteobacteria bacterium]|nr:hypothetical protein [Gammaproteobacteria bacterium]
MQNEPQIQMQAINQVDLLHQTVIKLKQAVVIQMQVINQADQLFLSQTPVILTKVINRSAVILTKAISLAAACQTQIKSLPHHLLVVKAQIAMIVDEDSSQAAHCGRV